MMLHEAVMLEIYRQALSASELASPRCQSRESNASAHAGDARCPSNESHCSANDCLTPAPTPTPNSPVGLPLPATLAPAAAAALLPPQSAAMAAYLNAAAAAAQQNHLLLTNPLAAAASFVQQATQAASPRAASLTPNVVGDLPDTPALDFSRKRRESDHEDHDDDADAGMKHTSSELGDEDDDASGAAEDGNAPLDLTISTRKRPSSEEEQSNAPAVRKVARVNDYKPPPPPPLTTHGTWVPPLNPYLAAVAAASLSPKTTNLDWNGKVTAAASKITTNEATKALEKMTEMSRLGAALSEITESSASNARTNTSSAANGTGGGRHSAWQSHWLNKGADAAKDVFKCVWCKQSFPTLATLTTHMKETQHCGVNVPPTAANAISLPPTASTAPNAVNTNANVAAASNHGSQSGTARHSNTQQSASSASSSGGGASKSELNMLIKETMPLPRKLVRGQDVWLGKGAEQTRQILKCMWCGQSFRSLAEMTSHMQETQHYTNIISQEQIISWKSSDDKTGGGTGSSSGSGSSSTASNGQAVTSPHAVGTPPANMSSSNGASVNAVLTCKVCDQSFPTLKELSQHMVKNNHYKEHMLRATHESNAAAVPTPSPTSLPKRGRQTREKRKKSLPVRKLLELERAQHDYKSLASSLDSALKPLRDFAASTKITCEKCGSKIETAVFVEHIRKCLGDSIPIPPRKSTLPEPRSPRTPSSSSAQSSAEQLLGGHADILCPLPKEGEKNSSSAPSVLNAIEQLIEKSFDTRTRQSGAGFGDPHTPLGSSILKRLGIDDTSDYTKPLMDVQTMNFLRSYSNYAMRDRSASESSSLSERCNSRIEAYTPERQERQPPPITPRLTPPTPTPFAKQTPTPPTVAISVKSEPDLDPIDAHLDSIGAQKISVKKEFCMPDDEAVDTILDSEHAGKLDAKSTPLSPNSERSITPKSNNSGNSLMAEPKRLSGSSLVALSSMFDNLNNMTNNNNNNNSINNYNNNLNAAIETNNNNPPVAKKSNANPLAALQKLCDTTDTPPAANTRSSSTTHHSSGATSSNNNAPSGTTNNMLAFSWACNDAVMTASDSIIKCSFCDTPFCSKGAYRHHLSKVHFVKDNDSDTQSLKSPQLAASPKSTLTAASPKCSASRSPAAQRHSPTVAAPPSINPYDDSPQSKFLKYTELAKQLSSKNA